MRVITLTTDFGTRDGFVGTMKGVIAGIAPEARTIDLTHDLRPGDIRGGAFALAAAAPHFPPGTIHLAVVDPGVGSVRRAVALRTERAVFVGPDNGVLTWALRDEPIVEMRSIDNRSWFHEPVSHTFHGRDIFAPAAAHLAAGADFADIGEAIDGIVRLEWPAVLRISEERRLVGEVLHVDRFGNGITNLPARDLPPDAVANGGVSLICAGLTVALRRCYADVAPGEHLAVAGSSGLLELAVNQGDFAARHGLAEGMPVVAQW